ncbi:hypothetical protein FHS29_004182 [Saccharothrix tamanrassetensis]|uniref:Uncharacterized protein n=1 Tax=Saccharothrix tamanrassetensis TaxID=1051531 RepID=A0A841CND0_9PSEU|nr:hypothetical protein [Saccharothrix tamanrassetensis]MBB5957587.1 hypothetical protein [Saccharothrix tamanrassetensis]
MSRKTQRPKQRPIIVVHRPLGTPLTPAQRRVVDRCRVLPQLLDPLEAELTVSSAVADVATDEEFWAGIIEHAVSLPSRRNDQLLRVLAAMLTGRPREWAAGAVVPMGPALTVGEAWICDRSLDAGYLALICAYRFSAEHAMVFLIDELAGGIVRRAFVTRDVDVARRRLAEQGPLNGIGAEAAHWLLARSYERLDRNPELRVDADVRRTRLLAGRRIALAFG